jgi:hypothetical protein
MNHRATPRFWVCYRALPAEVQQLADRNYQMLLRDPRHPSLHFKKIGQFWSARVGLHYRALAVEANDEMLWVWIGTHEEYDRMLRSVT